MADQLPLEERLNILEQIVYALLVSGRNKKETEATRRKIFQNENRLRPLSPLTSDLAVRSFFQALERRESFEELRRRSDDFGERLARLESQQEVRIKNERQLLSEVKNIKSELHLISLDYAQFLAFLSESDALQAERFRRVLPGYVYLASDVPDLGHDLVKDVTSLGALIGFDALMAKQPARGSWFDKFFLRTQEALTRPEVQERLAKIERALELKHIDSTQSDVDLKLSKAALNIRKTLDGIPDGIINIGSIFGVKTTVGGKSRVAIVALTQEQMRTVRENPKMQIDPLAFLEAFAGSASAPPIEISEKAEDVSFKGKKKKDKPTKASRSLGGAEASVGTAGLLPPQGAKKSSDHQTD